MSTQRALEHLSDTLYKSFATSGQQRLDEAKFGLEGAKVQADIEKEKEKERRFKEFEEPLKRAALEDVERKRQQLARPFNVFEIVDPQSLVDPEEKAHLSSQIDSTVKTFFPGSSFRGGNIIKQDGAPLTWGEVEPQAENIGAHLYFNSDRRQRLRQATARGDKAAIDELTRDSVNPVPGLQKDLTNRLTLLQQMGHKLPKESIAIAMASIKNIEVELARYGKPVNINELVKNQAGQAGYVTEAGTFQQVPGAEGLTSLKGEKESIHKIEAEDGSTRLVSVDPTTKEATPIKGGEGQKAPKQPQLREVADKEGNMTWQRYDAKSDTWIDTRGQAKPSSETEATRTRVNEINKEIARLRSKHEPSIKKALEYATNHPEEYAGNDPGNQNFVVLRTIRLLEKEREKLSGKASASQAQAQPPAKATQKQIVRTGTDKATGKKVVQYSDGTVEYAK